MIPLIDDIRRAVLQTPNTPTYFLFKSTLKKRLDAIASIIDLSRIFYSVKANPHPSVLELFAQSGMGADVSSYAELRAALTAGFPANLISVVGPWKEPRLLNKIAKNGAARICIESLEQTKTISSACPGIPLFARLHFDASIKSSSKENMQTADSQFGLSIDEYRASLNILKNGWQGVHLYGQSDTRDLNAILHILKTYHESEIYSSGMPVQWGPGLGVSYTLDNPDPDLQQILTSANLLVPSPLLSLEIGRFLVASAVVFITEVVDIKQRDGCLIAVCDGGISSFARSMLTGAIHPAIALDKDICDPVEGNFIKLRGPSCTPLDYILTRNYFSSINIGTKIVIFMAGAYGFNISFNGLCGYKCANVHVI